MISHWDDVDAVQRESGHISGRWQSLTGESSEWIGVRRIRIDADKWSTPLHLEDRRRRSSRPRWGGRIRAGRRLRRGGLRGRPGRLPGKPGARACAHAPGRPEGLDVLAFGERHYAANTLLPRAGVSWLGPTWVLEGAPEDHPWKREAAVGPPEVGELADRPGRIVNVSDVEAHVREGATVAHAVRDSRRATGSLKTGLRLFEVPPASSSTHRTATVPRRRSSSSRRATARSRSGPTSAGWGARTPSDPTGQHGRPAGRHGQSSRRACWRRGLSVLAYGTRDPRDVTYYPARARSTSEGSA